MKNFIFVRPLSLLLVNFLLLGEIYPQVSKKYQRHGDQLVSAGNYQAGLKDYFMAMSYDSTDLSLRYSIAEALRLSNDYKKAVYYYRSVSENDRRKKFTTSLHHEAEIEKCLGLYSSSQKKHAKFIKKYPGDKSAYEYRKSLLEIENNLDMVRLMRDTDDIALSNAHPVNTPSSEFAAYFIDSHNLLYSTLRSDSVKRGLVIDSSRYYTRTYRSQKLETWQSGQPQVGFEDNEEVHIVNTTYSPKGEFVFFTECRGFECSIWKARVDSGQWLDYQILPEVINMKGFNASQPFIARIDGEDYLFFVSDRPGGKGKMDIWCSIAYSNGIFGEAVNLEEINSPGNDICPFYLSDENALYFSSNWYPGLGGFDIFRSVKDSSSYSAVENLGMPINSTYNDLYFRHLGNEAVLTSNREGSLSDKYVNCCNDLYFFEYKARSIAPQTQLSNLERIEKMLPLRLFFNNDEPESSSKDTLTSVLYSSTYVLYMSRTGQFETEYSKGLRGDEAEQAVEEINRFFSTEVKLGFEDLKTALSLLEHELSSGTKIELVIKGYASPLSESDYNKRLTLRRISSVENEITHFNKGVMKKFIESGQLVILRKPFGEDKLSDLVSDDRNDKRNAVFSKKASFERRVEIIAVRKTGETVKVDD